MTIKVMLIYPNHEGMNILPPAIGLLSACLKRDGFNVDLFDTTYYKDIYDYQVTKEEPKVNRLSVRPFKIPTKISLKHSSPFEDFRERVESFSPDLLALSATEDMFMLGVELLRVVRHHKILTIVGGVFATFGPDIALSFPEIDIVCRGEGEDALVELCKRLEKKQKFDDIPNLWVKKQDGEIVKNPIKLIDMDMNPLIDMSIFEEARYYRPMMGEIYRMFPAETHRGCPYLCAFCNSPSQTAMYKSEKGQSYLRRKKFDNMRKELIFYKDVMKAEFLYFWADTFFSWKGNEFFEFAELYEEIGLPFWCQTRVETVRKDRLEVLKKIGCSRMSFGLEHGNEKFRREKLNRRMPNQVIIDGLSDVQEVGIPFSVNNIIGFPEETRELAFDTIMLNRQFYADDRDAFPFVPFKGTPLRLTAEKLGFVKPNQIVNSILAHGKGALDMPQFPRSQINGLVKTFNFYVKFPESKWPEIERAESDTPDGQRLFDELRQEFIEKYWNKDLSFEDAAAGVDPHSPIY